MKRKNIIGIDFLRAIAIIAVIIYHISVKILPGGFIGVDLFFVISGYLLANSLVGQVAKKGDIKLFDNIKKRIKTLWPLLFLVIFVVTIYLTIFNKPVLEVSHKDIIPGLGFMSNWWLIFNKIGYFDSFIANPFKHLWYISVLVQSTIIIMILFKLSYVISKDNKFSLFKVLMIGLVIISFVLSQIFYDPQNVSRVYYGTDTRIYEIALGVLGYLFYPIGKLSRPEKINRKEKRKFAKTREISTIASIISVSIFIYCILNVYEFYPWIYRFGFISFAINSLVLLLSIGNENNYLYSIIRFIPIGILGKMSYSLYLWHYPILLLSITKKEANSSPNLTYTIIRLVFILIISSLTYIFIEQRNKVQFEDRNDRRARQNRKNKKSIFSNKLMIPFMAIFALGVFGVAIPFTSTAFVETSSNIAENKNSNQSNESSNEANEENVNIDKNDPNTIILDGKEKKKEVENKENKDKEKEESSEENKENKDKEKEESSEENNSESKPNLKYSQLVLVGDSLGVNVGNRLKELYPNSITDAKISRQLYDSIGIVESYSGYDSENTALIIMLGTNGYFSESNLEELVSSFPKSKKLIVNIKSQIAWEDSSNKIIADFAKKNKNTVLIDWNSLATQHPEYLEPDNTHLNYMGVDALIKMFEEELR